MKKIIFVFILLGIMINAFADNPPIKWGKVSKDEIQYSHFPGEINAPAVVLCNYGHMYFNTNPGGSNMFLFYKIHKRIKILPPFEGNKLTITIPYYDFSSELRGENAFKVKAQVLEINEKGKVDKNKIRNSAISYSKIDKYNRLAEIEFTELKPGSIIEYIYTRATLDFEDPEDWIFQDTLPTVKSIFEATIPETFQYILMGKNVDEFDISKQKSHNYTVSWYGYNYRWNNFSNTRTYGPSRIKTIHLHANNYMVGLKSIPSYKKHPGHFILPSNPPKLLIHLKYAKRDDMATRRPAIYLSDWEELTFYLVTTLRNNYDSLNWDQRKNLVYPSGYILYRLPSWKQINTRLLGSKKFGIPLKTHWPFESALDSILNDAPTQKEKMIHIYNYISNNIEWNGIYSVFLNERNNPYFRKLNYKISKLFNDDVRFDDETLKKPFKSKYGTSSEINMLLIYFLRKAQIEADPVLISTIDNGKIDTSLHIISQFNHVICRAKINNKTFYLDATKKGLPYSILPYESINGFGWLVRSNNPHWVVLKSNQTSALRSEIDLSITKEGINGRVKNIYEGYEAYNFNNGIQDQYFSLPFDKKTIAVSKENGKVHEEADIILKIDQKRKNVMEFQPIEIHKELQSEISEEFESNLMKPYVYLHEYTYSITYDDHIKFIHIPQDTNYTLPGRKFSFIVNTEILNNEISITYRLIQNHTYAVNDELSKIGVFTQAVKEKIDEKIRYKVP